MINKCVNCQKDTKNPKFCSRSCSATLSNKLQPKRLRKTKCNRCNNITKSYKHSLCEEHHKEYIESKSAFYENLTLEHYWNKKSLQNLHVSSKNAHIRLLGRYKHKEMLKLPCYQCGYTKHVELCHIKPIKNFNEKCTIKEVNDIKNVIQLCPNCHWEFDNHLLILEFPDQVRSQ
tara:strand:+ start:37371 stop:37895 length:525 start_codon:yes stop_codon:yes gene_type:complete